MKINFLNKPKGSNNLLWAFLFFVLPLSVAANENGFVERQIQPVFEKSFDVQSRFILVGGLASVGIAQSQDGNLRDEWKDNQKMSAETSDYGDKFGTYLVGPIIAVGQYVFDRDNSYSHIRALTYTTIVTHILKESVRRTRPNGSDHQSMPSGHTSSAFATATSLTYAYGWKAGVVMYPIATFVGLSRMADDMHWFSDVVAGAFIGVWMGRATFYNLEHGDSSTKSFSSFLPVVTHDRVGFLWDSEF